MKVHDQNWFSSGPEDLLGMNEYYVAWWNLENLFDIENSPNRSDKLNRVLAKELRGWTEEILDKKIGQLSKIISKMNDNKGPDLLGVCEVENKSVVEKLATSLTGLAQRNYKVIHADTLDKGG